MKNVTAMLLANTDLEKLTLETFDEVQKTLHKPMVLFMEEGTNEVFKYFNIAAKTMEELNQMFKYKYFDTPDLPEGEYVTIAGGHFVGVGEETSII